jgi:hypothetical protein
MSRSTKKPYLSLSKPGVMKKWKKLMSRKLRRVPLEETPNSRSCGSSWTSPNDGGVYWDTPKARRK